MPDLSKRIKDELSLLVEEGQQWVKTGRVAHKQDRELPLPGGDKYQAWYSRALRVVGQLLPDRLREFEELYRAEKRRKLDVFTYGINDYLGGLRPPEIDHDVAYLARLIQQLAILKSAHTRLDSILSDMTGVLRAELYDGELDASRALLKAGHLRPAGAVAGVVLESHLKSVCDNHGASLGRKKATLANLNDALKDAGVLDTPNWRRIQHLTDIRNLCCHAKDRDPSEDEVEELANGVEKAIKTIF